MDTLKGLLQKVLGRNYRLTDAQRLAELQANWAAGLGNIRPAAYRNKVLYLAADSAAAAHHARLAYKTIIDEYKKLCPGIEIRDIKIQTGISPKANSPLKAPATHAHTCPSCGQRYTGAGSVCVLCRNNREAKAESEIRRYLDDAPWARYRDIQQTLPHISEERFEHTLCDLREETIYYLWRFPEETAAIRYIMLKTGFTPEQINDKIIQEHLPKKLHRLIYGA